MTQPEARCGWQSPSQIAAKLAALAHPTRIEILRHLGSAQSCCCKDVVERFDLAQSTVSQHLKILVDAGLVRFAPDKQRSRYQLDRVALAGLSGAVTALLGDCCAPARSNAA
jgi:ArsR family transcriptional regulator, arsenate/arsenite/antimonite-responsive transcriptional repressor